MPERLYFSEVKEDRGDYYVEYQPPVSDNRFATLNLVFIEQIAERVEERIIAESNLWLEKYSVPIMATAFDFKEDIIRWGEPEKSTLVSWLDPRASTVSRSWNISDLTNFLEQHAERQSWRKIYTDIPFRADTEVKETAKQRAALARKQNRTLLVILLAWASVVPATLAIVQFFGPEWLSAIVLVYALSKAWQAALRLFGYSRPSVKESEERDKERKMRHYFYHCERNPDGFARLMIENSQKDSADRTRKEAEELKATK